MNRLIYCLPLLLMMACKAAPSKTEPDRNPDETPRLLKPEVKKIWIPPEINNNGREYIPGHFIFRIERGTSWSR
jgi:hypothetical protein